jgi:hypothetical protein
LTILVAVSYYFGHPTRAAVFAGFAGVAGIAAYLVPRLWVLFHRLWMRGAMAVGRLLSATALCVTFYFVLTPVGLLRRLAGRPPLATRWKDPRSSFWRDKPPSVSTLERYEKLY